MKTTATTEQYFIKEIQKRFPSSEIETLEEALNRIKDTEYEHIFESEIALLNNKLIAEFMEWKTPSIEVWTGTHKTTTFPNGFEHNEKLAYHKSWNWLMPAITRILNTFKEVGSKGAVIEKEIQLFLSHANLNDTYISVVEFIKWHNSQRPLSS